jgi:hypothetical protein
MATTVKNNVVIMTADNDTFAPTGNIKIKGTRLIAGTGATSALLKEGSTSGQTLMKLVAAIGTSDESMIPFKATGTIHLDLDQAAGSGAEVYIYLE